MAKEENVDFVAMVGAIVPEWLLLPDYAGPPGTVAVIQDADFPKNTLIFLHQRRIIAIVDRLEGTLADMPEQGTYDGIVVHPDEGPEARMGKEWCDMAEAAARKKMS
jgi:hypothetical protein